MRRTPSTRPSLLMFGIDRPREFISSSLVLYRVARSDSFSSAICIQQESKELNCVVLHVGSFCTAVVLNGIPSFPERFNLSCVPRPRATSILIQEHCSSFVKMVLGRSHYPYESQRSAHCSRLIENCHRWLH